MMITGRNCLQYIVCAALDRMLLKITGSQRACTLPDFAAWKSGRARASLRYDVNENTRSLSLAASEDVFATLTMSRRN